MESIRAEIKAGFEAVHRRIDDKHDAVMDRLDSMADDQDAQAKTVHEHSGLIVAIQHQLTDMRDKWHRRFNALQESIGLKSKDGELSPVTRLDIKTAVAIFCAGMAAIVGILKMIGKV